MQPRFASLFLRAQTVFYVTPAGAGTQTGTSWANAYPGSLLQAAITLSPTGGQVWVAGGSYRTVPPPTFAWEQAGRKWMYDDLSAYPDRSNLTS